MKLYDLMVEKLKEYPEYRERKNKNVFAARLLRMEYGFENMTVEKLGKMLTVFNTIDSTWRKIMRDNKYLQGFDYGEKEIIEQEKIIELGHEIGTRKLPMV